MQLPTSWNMWVVMVMDVRGNDSHQMDLLSTVYPLLQGLGGKSLFQGGWNLE